MKKIRLLLAGLVMIATFALASPAQACTGTGDTACPHITWDMYVTTFDPGFFTDHTIVVEYDSWFYDGPVNGSGFAKRWSRAVDAQDNVNVAADAGNPFTMNLNERNTQWDDSSVDWEYQFSHASWSGSSHTEVTGPCAIVPWGTGAGQVGGNVLVATTTSTTFPSGGAAITDTCDEDNNTYIDHAVIVVNVNPDWNLNNTEDTTKPDLEGAMTHEFGHVTGFGQPITGTTYTYPDGFHWESNIALGGFTSLCGSGISGGASNVLTMCAQFANNSQWFEARTLAHNDAKEFNEAY